MFPEDGRIISPEASVNVYRNRYATPPETALFIVTAVRTQKDLRVV
jgi:hypothetical protein